MRLLFITQAVDERDPVLGFISGWIRAFAGVFSSLSVICLRKGAYSLPENVSVQALSHDTECLKPTTLGVIVRKMRRARRFVHYSWRTRREYDAVFVHMNQEYILLAGILWRLLGKKVALWYNHTAGTFWTRTAMWLAHVVFHTSPYAFTAGTKKSVRMPAGIDTAKFIATAGVSRVQRSILYLGRIAPVKGVKTLVEAALLLHGRGAAFSLTICGDALPRDAAYAQEVHALAAPLVAAGKCRLLPAITNAEAPRLFSAHEVFVNLTPAGNYDKTVLEAAACGTLPVVSSLAFRDAFPPELFFEENNAPTLADIVEHIFAMTEKKRVEVADRLRKYVVETHNLTILVQKIYENLLSR